MAQIIDFTTARSTRIQAAYEQPATTYDELVARDAMVTRLTCAETAKLVRAAVAAAFPGVKFAIKSRTYSGGASIDVEWTDGPTTYEVNPVIKQFERSTFDSMTDSTIYHAPTVLDGRLVQFGADHIMAERSLSADFLTECAANIAKEHGVPAPQVYTSTSTFRGKKHTHAWIDRGMPGSPSDMAIVLANTTRRQ